MSLDWTEFALSNLQAIRDYIARTSPRYAEAFLERLIRRTELLRDMPMIGSEVPEYRNEVIRELLEHPYRILYRVTSDRVEVLAVIHGARQLPRTPPA